MTQGHLCVFSTDTVDDASYLEEFINPTLLPVLHDLVAEVQYLNTKLMLS
jgi:hypothetical protein